MLYYAYTFEIKEVANPYDFSSGTMETIEAVKNRAREFFNDLIRKVLHFISRLKSYKNFQKVNLVHCLRLIEQVFLQNIWSKLLFLDSLSFLLEFKQKPEILFTLCQS